MADKDWLVLFEYVDPTLTMKLKRSSFAPGEMTMTRIIGMQSGSERTTQAHGRLTFHPS